MKKSKIPITLTSIYGILVFLSLAVMFTSPEAELRGIFSAFLTIPWSLLFLGLLDKIAPHVSEGSIIPGVLVVILSAAINMALIYGILSFLVRKKSSNKDSLP